MKPELVAARVQGEEGTARAVSALTDAGVPRKNIEVLSALPLPPQATGGPMTSTRLPVFTFTGLVIGLAVGLLLSPGTVFLYPLVVGQQPIWSPPVLIIVYELTMWSIVVFTIVGFITEMRVLPRVPRYSLTPQGDEIYVVAALPPDLVSSRVSKALEEGGGTLIDLPAQADRPAQADEPPGADRTGEAR